MVKKARKPQGSVLYRSETNKMIGGVCGGLGEVFDIDPTVIRILFLIAFFFGGSGVLLYLILWLIVPTKSKIKMNASDSLKENVNELKDKANEIGRSFRYKNKNNSKQIFGIIVIFIGVMFLLGNFGFGFFNLHRLWPIFLILLGIFVIYKHNE